MTDETAIDRMRRELWVHLDNQEQAYIEAALREVRVDAEARIEALRAAANKLADAAAGLLAVLVDAAGGGNLCSLCGASEHKRLTVCWVLQDTLAAYWMARAALADLPKQEES